MTAGARPEWGPGTLLLGWLAAAAYLVAVPVAAGWPWDNAGPALFVALLTAGYAAVRIIVLVAGRAPLAHGLALGFAYVFLGIAPIAQLTRERFPWPGGYSDDTLLAASALALASTVCIDAGATLLARRHRATGAPTGASPDPTAAMWWLIPLAVCSAALALIVVGPEILVANRQTMAAALCPSAAGYMTGGGNGDLATCGLLTSLIRVPPVFAFIVAASAWRMGRRGGALATLVAAAALVVTSNPIGTPRAWVAVVAIGVVAPWLVTSLRLRRLVLVSMPLAILLVFPAGDFARTAAWGVYSLDPGRNLVEKPDFDVYQQLANGVEYLADGEDLQLGRQVASAALFFVPRSIWADKSIPTGDLVSWQAGYDFTNLSAPPALEGLVDFGIPGALLLSLVVGLATGRLDAGAGYGPGLERLAARALWIVEIGFLLYIMRGALLPAASYLGPILALHGAIILSARLRRPAVDTDAGREQSSRRPLQRVPGSFAG